MEYRLDREKIKYLVGNKQLKQNYIAYRLGVSERTVSRWMTGNVVNIKFNNLMQLAGVLEVDYHEIIQSEQQNSLVKKLLSSDLLSKLSPYGDFELVEEIFNALIPKTLGQGERADVFLVLANTKWRTHDYLDAKAYCHKALEIGQKLSMDYIIFDALFQLATIDSMLGDVKALAYFQEAYNMKKSASQVYKIGSLCNNYGMYLRELGYIDQAKIYLLEAFDIYNKLKKYYNLSITIQGLMTILHDLGDYEQALSYVSFGLETAEHANYALGKNNILLYELNSLMALERPFGEKHIKAVKYEAFDVFVTSIKYNYYLKYEQSFAEEYFQEMINHEFMIPFMKGLLYMEKYKHFANECDMDQARDILTSINCEKWLKIAL